MGRWQTPEVVDCTRHRLTRAPLYPSISIRCCDSECTASVSCCPRGRFLCAPGPLCGICPASHLTAAARVYSPSSIPGAPKAPLFISDRHRAPLRTDSVRVPTAMSSGHSAAPSRTHSLADGRRQGRNHNSMLTSLILAPFSDISTTASCTGAVLPKKS